MKPQRSLLICASARSGTTLLCRALADTGVAGRPEEYFLAEDPARLPTWGFWEHGPYGIEHGARDRHHYLEIVYDLGTTPNGLFAAKLMWNNLPWAIQKFRDLPEFAGLERAELLHRAFPDVHVVHVIRRDRVRQAVSWARMAQDGVWVVSDDEPAQPTREPDYSFELIDKMVTHIREGERGWIELFCELDVPVLTVHYEELASPQGYEQAIVAVLDHCGVLPDDLSVPAPRTHKQADELNDQWVRRYYQDRSST